MLTLSLTRHQLYELYYEGPRPTIRLIEELIEQLADFERVLGVHQQRTIDSQRTAYQRQAAKLERVEEKLWKQQRLNYQLLNRVQELQTELERVRQGQGEVLSVGARRDSHNSGLPPSLDLPSVKAANAVKRTRSLRRKSGKSVGGQPGHAGATLRQVEFPDRVQVHAPQKCRHCTRSRSFGGGGRVPPSASF